MSGTAVGSDLRVRIDDSAHTLQTQRPETGKQNEKPRDSRPTRVTSQSVCQSTLLSHHTEHSSQIRKTMASLMTWSLWGIIRHSESLG